METSSHTPNFHEHDRGKRIFWFLLILFLFYINTQQSVINIIMTNSE